MILMVPPISFIQTYPVVEAARVWDRASFADPHCALKQKLAQDEPQPDGLGEILHTRCWRCRRIEPRKNPPVNPVSAARAMFGPESAPTARDGGRIALWRRLSCSKSP